MSDARFARLKSDPRFRQPRKHKSKVVVDERFKSALKPSKKSEKGSKGRVDKYGRSLAADHETDNLKRFYRLENEEETKQVPRPDLARGEVLMESSDEDDVEAEAGNEFDDEAEEEVVLGQHRSKPILVLPEEEELAEIDLDESEFADLDAQAASAQREEEEEDAASPAVKSTTRLAIVNLDWDHVRSTHLFKVCSSVLATVGGSAGRVLRVAVYPSEFGKTRMAKEDVEGPPPSIFKKSGLIQEDTGEDYDESALRKYQLERLRYYYAIVTCNTPFAASRIFSELNGTELEQSANVFDLSYVPEGMTFEDEPRDESTDDMAVHSALTFSTDALRHSKVKLRWDEDEPERQRVTRRHLTKAEIEDNDFRAYIASSESESDEEDKVDASKRDKMRALLLGGDPEDRDDLPEGWGASGDVEADDKGMEITFTPALSGAADANKEETTLDAYRRKTREKKTKRKEARQASREDPTDGAKKEKDEFFGDDSDEPSIDETDKKPPRRVEATAEELEQLAASTSITDSREGLDHFDMRAVLKAEKHGKKQRKKERRRREITGVDEANEGLQADFQVDAADPRFKALHEDHEFAIDPSNPRFTKTQGMATLLEERSEKNRKRRDREGSVLASVDSRPRHDGDVLNNLVESVKRKSHMSQGSAGRGKRQRL